MLLAALWFSEEKPTISTLLGPLMEELNDLLINGIYSSTVTYIHVSVHILYMYMYILLLLVYTCEARQILFTKYILRK